MHLRIDFSHHTGMLWPAERHEWERYVPATRAQLDEATFTAAWAEGQAMSLEQAVAYALEEEADSGYAEAGAG